MSEKIYAEIPEDFVRRMRNWARAISGVDQARDVAISSIYTLGVRVDRYVNTTIPTLLGEAADTDSALQSVPIRYRQAVRQFWLYEGLPMREHARRSRPGLDYHTFERWVMRGHQELLGSIYAQTNPRRIAAPKLFANCA